MPRKPILTRADLISFYVRQAYEQASWARPAKPKRRKGKKGY